MSERAKRDQFPIPLLNGETPWYVRTAIIVVFYLGLPTLLLAVLLGMGVGWIPSPIIQTHEITRQLEGHIRRMKQVEDAHMRLLAMICRNTAYTQITINECIRAAEIPPESP